MSRIMEQDQKEEWTYHGQKVSKQIRSSGLGLKLSLEWVFVSFITNNLLQTF